MNTAIQPFAWRVTAVRQSNAGRGANEADCALATGSRSWGHRASVIGLGVLALAVLMLVSTGAPAVAGINIIDVRSEFVYNTITYSYEPGDPSKSINAILKYSIDAAGTYRVDLWDRGSNSAKLSRTITHSSAGTYWLQNTVITWKPTADSYEYRAYQKVGTSWILKDSVIGSVPADGHWGAVRNWSPNQYTWGYRYNFDPNSDFVEYMFHFWWFNHPGSGKHRGTERLNVLKDRLSDLPGQGQLQVEFLRTSVNSTSNKDGWDAYKYYYWQGHIVRESYGGSSDLPGWYLEGEENWSNNIYIGDDEEIQIISSYDSDFSADAGSDPSGFYNNGYFTRVRMYRHPGWRGTDFWMRIGFEAKEHDLDVPPLSDGFDGADAAIHTTQF